MLRMVTLAIAALVPTIVAAQTTGAAKSPLTLHAACASTGATAVIRVQIANTAARPTAVALGFTPPGEQTHVVTAIGVSVIRPATGATEEYVYENPKYALAKGTPWIVSIAPGATHDVELPLHDFISTMSFANLDVSVAAGGRLVLEAPPAKGSPQVWSGKIDVPLEGCG